MVTKNASNSSPMATQGVYRTKLGVEGALGAMALYRGFGAKYRISQQCVANVAQRATNVRLKTKKNTIAINLSVNVVEQVLKFA